MKKVIKLDPTQLLGFKIAAKSAQVKAPTAKLGDKPTLPGAKLGQKDD